jgi:hypothetical protein
VPNNWISHRCYRTGGNLRSNPAQQRKGPLRKIVGINEDTYTGSTNMFERPLVILECGHMVHSDGMHKARCPYCPLKNGW